MPWTVAASAFWIRLLARSGSQGRVELKGFAAVLTCAVPLGIRQKLARDARLKAAMQIHSLFQARISVFIASSIIWILFVTAPAAAESNVASQNIIAVSGIVTGNVQEVGFRAMIQKQAILNVSNSCSTGADEMPTLTFDDFLVPLRMAFSLDLSDSVDLEERNAPICRGHFLPIRRDCIDQQG
jgi:hypothetical protein